MSNKEEMKEFYLSVIELIGEKIELQYKIEKAIEYIEKRTKETDFDNDRLIDILDILKGSDKND